MRLAVLWLLLLQLQAGRVGLGQHLEARLDTVRRILHEVPLVDGHNDLPWNIRKFLKNQLVNFRFAEDLRDMSPWSRSSWSHTDLLRLREGMVAAQFWSAYVPCSTQHLDAVQLALEQIDVIRRLVAKYPTYMTLVTSTEGIERAHESGLLASLIGVEGGHAIGTSLGVLRMLYQLGARYLTLTHTCNTPWADCSIADEPGHLPHIGGLSPFGINVYYDVHGFREAWTNNCILNELAVSMAICSKDAENTPSLGAILLVVFIQRVWKNYLSSVMCIIWKKFLQFW
ncbi:dipeptidase 1-like isoform X1 [Periplaneta americana]|uniref:dipeptidase 1-like isoform X1 n=1 Tax=Periplaneta americana TaxID=6978 RepID=UPI0037E80BA3